MEIIVKDESSNTDPQPPESRPLPVPPPPPQPSPEQATINLSLTTELAEMRETQSETLTMLRQIQSTLEEVTMELPEPESEPKSETEETIVVEPPAPLELPVANEPDKKDDIPTTAPDESLESGNLFRRILLGKSKARKA